MNQHASTDAAMTRLDYLLYTIVVLIWGSSWIALKLQLGPVAPEVSVLWRFSAALLILFPIVLIRRERLAFPLHLHLRFALIGSLLFSSNFIFFYYGGLTTPSGLLAVVFSLASIGNLLIGALLARKRPSARLAFGGLLGTLGSALMFAPQIMDHPFGWATLQGLVFCLLGTLSFCWGNVVAGSIQRSGVSVLSSTVWGMVYGVIGMTLFVLVEGGSFHFETTPSYIGSLIYLAIFGSVIAFISYLTLLGRIGAPRAGYSTVLYPVIALLLSTVLEDFHWTMPAFAGLFLVLVGNVVVLNNSRK
jgi:drug/metabolite transporter (DMT)-like permease